MGLRLNCSKCELVTQRRTRVTDPILSLRSINVSDVEMLRAPLFDGQDFDDAAEADRLKLIDAQDALILLRSLFSAPNVQHLMRCSPSVDNPVLMEFDNQLRTAVSRLTNCDLSDEQCLQASLPVKFGGVGLRRVSSSLALPAFLASAVSTLQLQTTILAQTSTEEFPIFAAYMEQWRWTLDAELPDDTLPTK